VVRSISPEEAAKLERDNQLSQKQIQQLRETIDAMMAEASEVTLYHPWWKATMMLPVLPYVQLFSQYDEQAKRIAELKRKWKKSRPGSTRQLTMCASGASNANGTHGRRIASGRRPKRRK
jgi:hypothetical protein